MQQLFDRVKEHLLKQGCKSIAKDFGCAYRGDNGTKCAVGCLIPDDRYNPSMEGSIFNDEFVKVHALEDLFPDETQFYFINDLQRVHDSRNVDQWEYELSKIASIYGLNG